MPKKKDDAQKKKINYPIMLIAIVAIAIAGLYFANALNLFEVSQSSAPAYTTTATTSVTTKPPAKSFTTTTTVAATVGPGTPAPSVVTLEIKSWGYNPDAITLSQGSTATWTNKDSAVHTVTGSGNFDSGDIAAGESWSYTFNTPGTYEYSCGYHPEFKGTVIID